MFYSKKFYSLLVFCIFVNLSSSDFQDLCDVSNDCEGKTAGTGVQDPLDCHSFYECVLNTDGEVIVSDASISCPNDEYFDEDYQACVTETYQCSNLCSNLFCTKTCDGLAGGTPIPVPYDCNQYQICEPQAEINPIVPCDSNIPYFNGTHCSSDPYSCCNICTPYCATAFTQVEDPANCNWFYLCQDVDYIPGSSSHYECPDETYFDRTLGQCVDGNNCTTVCDAENK